MANPYDLARRCIKSANANKLSGCAFLYRAWMQHALGYINQIPNPEHRKKYVSMWFAAFNRTNAELRKSS